MLLEPWARNRLDGHTHDADGHPATVTPARSNALSAPILLEHARNRCLRIASWHFALDGRYGCSLVVHVKLAHAIGESNAISDAI